MGKKQGELSDERKKNQKVIVDHGVQMGIDHLDSCVALMQDGIMKEVWEAGRVEIRGMIIIEKLKRLA